MSEFPPAHGAASDGRNLRIDTEGVHYGPLSTPLNAIVVQKRVADDPYFWGRVVVIMLTALFGVSLYGLFHWEIGLLALAPGLGLLFDSDIRSRKIYSLELSRPGEPPFFGWSDRQIFWVELYERRIEDALALARDGVDPEFNWEKKRRFEIEEDRRTNDFTAYERSVSETPAYRLGRLQFRKTLHRSSINPSEVRNCGERTGAGGATSLFSDRTDNSVIWLRSSRWVTAKYNLKRVCSIDKYLKDRQSIIATESNHFMPWGEIDVSSSGVLLHWEDEAGGHEYNAFLPHGVYEIALSTFASDYLPLKTIAGFSVENDVPTLKDRCRPTPKARVDQNTTKVQSL